jgi:hypothetical protein
LKKIDGNSFRQGRLFCFLYGIAREEGYDPSRHTSPLELGHFIPRFSPDSLNAPRWNLVIFAVIDKRRKSLYFPKKASLPMAGCRGKIIAEYIGSVMPAR